MLVNRELIRPPRVVSDGFDLHLLGNCDDVVHYLCKRLQWELPPLPVPQSATAPPQSAATLLEIGGAENENKEGVELEGERKRPSPPPLPSFLPPNSYVFSVAVAASEGMMGTGVSGVGSKSRRALGEGGSIEGMGGSLDERVGHKKEEQGEDSSSFVEVIIW